MGLSAKGFVESCSVRINWQKLQTLDPEARNGLRKKRSEGVAAWNADKRRW